MLNRNMVTLVHADNFFGHQDIEELFGAVAFLQYQPTDYGMEIPRFQMFTPGIEKLLSKAVGESVTINKETSGVFRKPMFGIHFEGFEQPDEWCFVIALEPTTFNVFHHVSGAENAMQGYQFNYRDPFQWGDAIVNIELKRNQGLFFRPWMFHSLDKGVVQYYRLTPTRLSRTNNAVIDQQWCDVSISGKQSIALKKDGTLWVAHAGTEGFRCISDEHQWKQLSGRYALKTDGSLWSVDLDAVSDTNIRDVTHLAKQNNEESVLLCFTADHGLLVLWNDDNWYPIFGDWIAASMYGDTIAAVRIDGTLWIKETVDSRLKHTTRLGDLSNWVDVCVWKDGIIVMSEDRSLWEIKSDGSTAAIKDGTDVDSFLVRSGLLYMCKSDGAIVVKPIGHNESHDIDYISGTGLLCKTKTTMPIQIPHRGWDRIVGNGNGMAVIAQDGTLWMWGNNTNGLLGLSERNSYMVPTQIKEQVVTMGPMRRDDTISIDYRYVSAGSTHSIGIKTDGSIWGWGDNDRGQLSMDHDQDTTKVSVPTQIVELGTGWRQVYASDGYSVGIKRNGEMRIWGQMRGGDEAKIIYTRPDGWVDACTYAGSDDDPAYVLAISRDGSLVGISADRRSVTIGDTQDWSMVCMDDRGSIYAIKKDGSLWASLGQRRDGFPHIEMNLDRMIMATDRSTWVDMAATNSGLMLLRDDGSMAFWDRRMVDLSEIDLGDGEHYWMRIDSSGDDVYAIDGGGQMVRINTSKGLSVTYIEHRDWNFVSAGEGFVLAIDVEDQLWRWGSNTHGQLGIGDTSDRLIPVTVR